MGNTKRSTISNRLIGMGDSHLDNFTYFCAASCRIPGATSYGLTNPQSDTKAREAFLGFLSAFPKSYIPLLCVGEVDCNSLPWRIESEDKPYLCIHKSLAHLFQFIKEVDRKFILPSVTLPPVEDYRKIEARLHVSSSKQERTDLVKLYNRVLKTTAEKNGHSFIDITTPTTGKDGLVDQSFIRSTSDAHLMPSKLYPIVKELLDGVTL